MENSKKTYVLDTNVILSSADSLLNFENCNIIIPDIVIDELDKFKVENNDRGNISRKIARYLDNLRNDGNLLKGVEQQNNSNIKVELGFEDVELPSTWDKTYNDSRILQICKGLQEKNVEVALVTRDVYLRIKADTLGIKTEDYKFGLLPEIDQQYTGRKNILISKNNILKFYEKGYISLQDLEITEELLTNQFLIMRCEEEYGTALGRFDGEKVVKLNFDTIRPYGVIARNATQKFMQEALIADANEAPLVIIKGPAGTAKTFYALAVGLYKTAELHEYRKILVCRPTIKMDEDIGFLPGTEREKLSPYMRPIYDNLEILIDINKEDKYKNEKELEHKANYFFDSGIITSEAIGFLRGRSIVKNYMIIDEAQNLTPSQAKAVITRASEGTKIIMLGDPEQIDHPLLNSRTNGLSYSAEKMKGNPLCWQITLGENEALRSELAKESAKIL